MIKRESYLEDLRKTRDINLIKVVTGVRRSGKSTLLEQFREELLEEGVSGKNIIAFNLEEKENARYLEDPDLLYNTVMQLVEPGVKNYVFIDEVQYIPEFEKTVDSLFVKKNIDLYVTGSNAEISSSKIATLLTGRYIEIKMQPLTFREFREFFPATEDTTELFNKFLRYGGFPEVANMLVRGAEIQAKTYLRNIYHTILEKDIRDGKNIKDLEAFRLVVDYMLDNAGNVTSANNIASTLAANGRKIDNATVEKYINAMADCYILYRAKRYDIRGKALLRTLEKYYTVDLGLANAVLERPDNADIGRRVENLVFLELNKRYREVRIGKNQDKEVDFVVQDEDGVTEYFQVALSAAEPATIERELGAFSNLQDGYKRTLLTLDPIETDENGVLRRNLMRWLLGR